MIRAFLIRRRDRRACIRRALEAGLQELNAMRYEELHALPDSLYKEVRLDGEAIQIQYIVLEREPGYMHISVAGPGIVPMGTSEIFREHDEKDGA